MLQFLSTWSATAISLFITAYLLPGLTISGFTAAIVGAVALGFVNAIVRPILIIFTLPVTILTLGLFLLVVNAITFGLVGYLTPGFSVEGFFPAIFGTIVLSFISSLVDRIFLTFLPQETSES